MFWGNADAVHHEQHLDNLRRAEHERLVNEVEAANPQPGLWQSVKTHLAGWTASGEEEHPRQFAHKSA
ncbi:MAG: hypothetical protein FOGNACKC_03301 [Anaerolineae bacterium]|nr:hypothetical protein [Anaerolineae bacterium]